MTQTRIVVNAKLKPLAQELVLLTGVDSLSDLLSLLLTKYGRHLKSTWEMPPQPIVNPVQVVYPAPEFNQPPMVPIQQHEPASCLKEAEPDPTIARIASLIDTF